MRTQIVASEQLHKSFIKTNDAKITLVMRTYFIETALDSKFLAQLSFGSSISK